jgi:hypothetical protein
MKRRKFLTALATLPLPFTVPWLQGLAERHPELPMPVAPAPEPLRCACGDWPIQPGVEDIIIRYSVGPVDWERHRTEECFKQQRSACACETLDLPRRPMSAGEEVWHGHDSCTRITHRPMGPPPYTYIGNWCEYHRRKPV